MTADVVRRGLRAACLGALIAAVQAPHAAAQGEACDAACPVPCMFGLCPTIDADPNCSKEQAENLWAKARNADDCFGYDAFVEACPTAPEAPFARAELKRRNCGGQTAAPIPRPPEEPQAPSPRTKILIQD